MEKAKIIAISNQKGGTGKTTTACNLGYALAKLGKKVLIADLDPQANLTMSFGVKYPDELETSMHEALSAICEGAELPPRCKYILSGDALDIIPSNINLTITEINLRDEIGGENTLRGLLKPLQSEYDFIIIDTNPYLGLLTINALAACDEIIIPVSPQLWSATGLTDLMKTIHKVRRKINPQIKINGILLTMCDERTNLFKDAYNMLQEFCQDKIRIFGSRIPSTVRVGEANYYSQSVAEYDAKSKAAIAYMSFAKEVIDGGGSKDSSRETATA